MSINTTYKELAPAGLQKAKPHTATLHEAGTRHPRVRTLRMYREGAPLPDNPSGTPAIRSGRRVSSALLALGLITGLGVNLAGRAAAQTNSPGLAVQLTGTNHLVADPSPGLGLSNQLTFEAWVNPAIAKCNTILSRGNGIDSLTDYIFQVGYDGTNCGVMKIGFFGAGAWDASTSTVPLNTWTHVAVTYDGTNKNFYINGVLDRTAPRSGSLHVTTDSPLYLGRQGSVCNCNFFQGQMDELRIWNILRTPAQISQNFRQSLAGTEPGLVAYYRFDENGGPALDASGNGNTATPTSGTVWTISGAPMLAPIATTLGASNVLAASATLYASVNPNNLFTSAWFDYGLTTNYGSSTPPVALSGTNASLTVTAIANGLTPNQTYQYRVVATNSAGTNFGLPQTFQTPAIVLLSPNIGTGGYFGFTLSGPAGFKYNIDSSADLSNWATLSTLSNATGLIPFIDSNTPASTPRFYRARITDFGLTEPGLPRNLLLTPGGASMSVSWTAPATNGGSAIDFYSVWVLSNGQLVNSNTTSGTFLQFSGLTTANYPYGTVGRSYQFYVWAHNAIGYGNAASGTATPKVSYLADNLRGIWSKQYGSGMCTSCHGPGLAPNLSTQTGNPPTDYSSAVNEGPLIYQVPAGLAAGHHNGFGAFFTTSSLEYATLFRWVSDGQLQ